MWIGDDERFLIIFWLRNNWKEYLKRSIFRVILGEYGFFRSFFHRFYYLSWDDFFFFLFYSRKGSSFLRMYVRIFLRDMNRHVRTGAYLLLLHSWNSGERNRVSTLIDSTTRDFSSMKFLPCSVLKWNVAGRKRKFVGESWRRR